MIDKLQTSLSALNTFKTVVHGAAYNIANISTDDFQSIKANLADGPEGLGVHVSAISRNGKPVTNRDNPPNQREAKAPSATDLPREMVTLVMGEKAFQANTKVVTVVDEMLGSLLDIKS